MASSEYIHKIEDHLESCNASMADSGRNVATRSRAALERSLTPGQAVKACPMVMFWTVIV